MKIELRNHPAQARHPVTGDPLFHDEAKTQPVRLILDQKSIYLDGIHIGYCGTAADRPVSFTRRLPDAVTAEVVQLVTETYGAPRIVSQPPRQDLVAEAEQMIVEADEDEEPEADEDE